MFRDEDDTSNLTEAIVKHYKNLLNVPNFSNPKDLERLRLQVKFDMLERLKEDSPWT